VIQRNSSLVQGLQSLSGHIGDAFQDLQVEHARVTEIG